MYITDVCNISYCFSSMPFDTPLLQSSLAVILTDIFFEFMPIERNKDSFKLKRTPTREISEIKTKRTVSYQIYNMLYVKSPIRKYTPQKVHIFLKYTRSIKMMIIKRFRNFSMKNISAFSREYLFKGVELVYPR